MYIKNNLLSFAAIFFLFINATVSHAMEIQNLPNTPNPPNINNKILNILENFTADINIDLSPEEKQKLEEMIQVLVYSNVQAMTDSDFAKFSQNCQIIRDYLPTLRQYYLQHLNLKLDANDNIHIDVKMTILDMLKSLATGSAFCVKTIYPCCVLASTEWTFYSQLQAARERGEDYHHILRNMILWPPLMWIVLDFNNPFLSALGTVSVMVLSSQSNPIIGEAFNELKNDAADFFGQYFTNGTTLFWQLYNIAFPGMDNPMLPNIEPMLLMMNSTK